MLRPPMLALIVIEVTKEAKCMNNVNAKVFVQYAQLHEKPVSRGIMYDNITRNLQNEKHMNEVKLSQVQSLHPQPGHPYPFLVNGLLFLIFLRQRQPHHSSGYQVSADSKYR